jgi:hypothetical protein
MQATKKEREEKGSEGRKGIGPAMIEELMKAAATSLYY